MRISDWSSDVCLPIYIIRGAQDRRMGRGQAPSGHSSVGKSLRADVTPEPRGAGARAPGLDSQSGRSEEHTSELQSLMRNSYAVFCLKKKNKTNIIIHINNSTRVNMNIQRQAKHTVRNT